MRYPVDQKQLKEAIEELKNRRGILVVAGKGHENVQDYGNN